jgi:anti-sigma-K factor RskA
MYGKEASNRKQEIDRQHHTIPNQRNQRQALWKNQNFWIFPQIQT